MHNQASDKIFVREVQHWRGSFKKGKRELCNDTSLQPVIRSYPIRPFHVRTGVNVAHFGVIGFEVVAVVFQNTVVVVWLSHNHTLFGTQVTSWSIYLVSYKKVIKFKAFPIFPQRAKTTFCLSKKFEKHVWAKYNTPWFWDFWVRKIHFWSTF